MQAGGHIFRCGSDVARFLRECSGFVEPFGSGSHLAPFVMQDAEVVGSVGVAVPCGVFQPRAGF